jgi:SAM-dependent methyltransferase
MTPEPPDKARLLEKMKSDWNRRARDNAALHIATINAASEDEFDDSGARDTWYTFRHLEHLLHKEQVVLDIGCGMGRMDAHVAPRVKKLVGIDVSGEMVAGARARLGHLPNVEFLEGDGCSLRPLPDRSFGLVFSHIVFQHMPREGVELYSDEVFRVLRPNGHFVFQVPEALEGVTSEPVLDDTFEMRFHREDAVRRMLEGYGFKWRGASRFRVTSLNVVFDQLRVHAQRDW